MRKATIADVAHLAGVSIKTVSRVANREPNVREGTREKVQSAIEALNYRPSPSARRLAGRRSFLIGLIYDNPSASYLLNVQNGALAATRVDGYDLVIHPCEYRDPGLLRDIGAMVQQSRVDGVILTPPLSDQEPLVRLLQDELHTPLVRVSPANSTNGDNAVYTNDRGACEEMTRYLVSLGHRKIAFIMGHPDHGAVAKRFTGYKDGLRAAGIAMNPAWVRQGFNNFESGKECTEKLLAQPDPPTAIFAANDDMAAGVMHAAHELGIAIPDQLSVAGFDDIPLARQVWPSLTTIRQPIRDMAQIATELLLRNLRGEDAPEISPVIDSSLVVRHSTGPAPAAKPQ